MDEIQAQTQTKETTEMMFDLKDCTGDLIEVEADSGCVVVRFFKDETNDDGVDWAPMIFEDRKQITKLIKTLKAARDEAFPKEESL